MVRPSGGERPRMDGENGEQPVEQRGEGDVERPQRGARGPQGRPRGEAGPPARGPSGETPRPGAPEQRGRPTTPAQQREVPPDGGPPPAGVRNIEAFERSVVMGVGSVDDPMAGRGPLTGQRPPPSIGEYERDAVGGDRGVARFEDDFLRML